MRIILIIFIFATLMSLMSENSTICLIINHLPESTPDKAELFLAGNFNNWDPASEEYKFVSQNDVFYQKLILEKGKKIEFKITRGGWDTVEKSKDGQEINNRKYTCSSDQDTIYISIENWRDKVESYSDKKSTQTGNIVIHPDFYIPQLDRKRSIRIYLPPDYDDTNKHFPVLYMHDGQNLFDEATSFVGEWKVDETLEKLYSENIMNGIIVVGIDNHPSRRLHEYSPWYNTQRDAGAEGAAYLEFIVNTLKPWIDSNYRTLPEPEHTGIAGSSMGGLISLYAGCKYPYIFSRLGIFSPAFWFAKDQLVEFINKYPLMKQSRLYIDVGTEEGNDLQQRKAYLNDAKDIYKLLIEHGLPEDNAKLIIDEGARHHEGSWARRFPAAMIWLWK